MLYLMLTSNVELKEDHTIEMLNSSFLSVITCTRRKNTKLTDIACISLSSASAVIDLSKQPDLFPSLLGFLCVHLSDPTLDDKYHTLSLSSLKLIRVLSAVKSNRPIMLREESRICSDTCDNKITFGLLHCLALVLKPSGQISGGIGSVKRSDLQKEAAGVLVELARDSSAQSVVVEYPDLLSSFTRYCTNAVGPNGPERDEAKKALMRLVAKL